ncbi:hypothetical protein XENOCAPTIV_001910 [Xenoophorus captivus]|uniref:Uncharacterized protein n=1 Tax=Xenoophorus captivus TaxID=1517983 RepID=A0ABV0R7L4_9TELE
MWATSRKDPNDFYETVWLENQDLAEETLKLPFLQHMQLGDLQADSYTIFMIQDIYYLAKVTDMLKKISEKVLNDDLKKFMEGRYESYNRFKIQMLEDFHLNANAERAQLLQSFSATLNIPVPRKHLHPPQMSLFVAVRVTTRSPRTPLRDPS